MNIGVIKNPKRQEGWTLAEVMVSVAVLALMAISLFAGFAYGFRILQTTREDLRATQVITQKMESIRLCTWAQLTNQCPSTFTETYSTTGTNVTGGVTYYGTISLSSNTNLPSGYQSSMEMITVTLKWTNYSTATRYAWPHTRSMQTQYAFYGLQNYLYGVTNVL
jgi:type II secretory pathway pseudopilin PulG